MKKSKAAAVEVGPLHTKYRPGELSEVVGHKEVVKSLESALEDENRPHAFLFTGPSGTGKTTLARIVAKHVGCDPANILEVDAATNTGIDAMREITSSLKYQGFGDSPNKMIILDEVHALSKSAWTALLKSIEEPPAHVFFALCTTDSGKVPTTVVTRCLTYNLKPLRYDDLMDLLEDVADKEGLDTPDHILGMIGRSCNGSPRQALVMLSMLKDVTNQEEAAALLEQPLEDKEVIDLARLLVKGDLDWGTLQKTLKALTESNPEAIRIIIVNYLNSCLMGAKSERDVPRLLDILYSFSKPCNPTDKMAPILLAFGEYIFK